MSAWSATVLGDATTRGAPIAHIHMRSVITVMATILAMVVATILAMVLATDITADRVSELVSARSASAFGNPQSSSNTFGPAVLKTGGFVTSGRLQIFCVPAMTALGQKQTCAAQKVMSALPPRADICGALGHVRFVPKADPCTAANSISIRSPRRRAAGESTARRGRAPWRS